LSDLIQVTKLAVKKNEYYTISDLIKKSEAISKLAILLCDNIEILFLFSAGNFY
jgi:hypothetical protein